MNTIYLKNIPLAHGEVSIVTSDNANTIMKHSCEMAKAVKKMGVGVMVVNTGLSSGRFRDAAEAAGIDWPMSRNSRYAKQHGVPLLIHNSYAGDLVSEIDELWTICNDCRIEVVIITSWEWTSSSWRRKERLLYELRRWMEERNIAVVIYTQHETNTTSGRYDRGGTGRLATIAMAVTELEMAMKSELLVDRPTSIAVDSEEEAEYLRRSAQLLRNEINKIPGVSMPIEPVRKKLFSPDNREEVRPLDDEENLVLAT